MRRGLGRTLLLAVVIAGLAAGYLVFLAPPSVPANAAMLPIARTTMTGAIAPDMASEDGAEVPPASPNGQACLDRIERSSGWADVCWQAYREPADSDPQKDYYWLRIYGSYQPSGAAGIRWLVVKSRLVDPPSCTLRDEGGDPSVPRIEFTVCFLITCPDGNCNGRICR